MPHENILEGNPSQQIENEIFFEVVFGDWFEFGDEHEALFVVILFEETEYDVH
jgi:hypothetical protein